MEAFAYGEIKISRSEFWGMTPREFWNACDGHNKKKEKDYQIRWEQTRWQAAVQVNSFTKKTIQPQDLLKFPWESEAIDRSEEIKKIKEYRKWLEQ